MHYDVIVVGAGPAGNNAAWELARRGANVALLEKQTLPRHKTCGGGIPMVAATTLHLAELRDLAPEAFVECNTRWMRHTFRFADPYLAPMNPDEEAATQRIPKADTPPSSSPIPPALSLWMVQRSVFDNALAQRAAQAGASLRDGLAVRSVEQEASGRIRVRAESTGGTWEATADTVIGADGANGMVARSVGLRKERALAIAIEVESPHRWGEGHPDLRPDVCHLEYGAVRRGYAWVFPKGDHLNVGAGVFRPRRADGRGDNSVREELHQAIHAYMEMLGVPRAPGSLVYHAHPLPIWDGLAPLQAFAGRVLLAGDAAGLINPFFGDGILHALHSGQIVAHCILEGRQAQYTEAIGAAFRSNFDAALRLAKFFYQWPGFCYRHGVKRPGATRTATRLLCGELQFDAISGRVMRRIQDAMRLDRHAEDRPANA